MPLGAARDPRGGAERVVVLDIGNVVIVWDPLPAIAAVVGEARARAFLDGDFGWAAWNLAQDAGRGWADAEAAGIASHPHLAQEIRAYRANFARTMPCLVPGTAELMRALRARGTRLVGLTNFSAETFPLAQDAFADALGLFDDIVVSGAEGVAKPDPAIFAVLARRLRRPLDGVPFVDDSTANVAAARAAGMDAIRFTGADRLRVDLLRRSLL